MHEIIFISEYYSYTFKILWIILQVTSGEKLQENTSSRSLKLSILSNVLCKCTYNTHITQRAQHHGTSFPLTIVYQHLFEGSFCLYFNENTMFVSVFSPVCHDGCLFTCLIVYRSTTPAFTAWGKDRWPRTVSSWPWQPTTSATSCWPICSWVRRRGYLLLLFLPSGHSSQELSTRLDNFNFFSNDGPNFFSNDGTNFF